VSGPRAGFTLLELVLILSIAGIVGALVAPPIGELRARQEARNARDAYVWLAQRARLHAVERGTTVVLELDPASGRAWAVRAGAADTLGTIDFTQQHGVWLAGVENVLLLCYGPRGFGVACGGGAALPAEARFRAGRADIGLRIHPLGQMERL
jgi:hypothetical protein